MINSAIEKLRNIKLFFAKSASTSIHYVQRCFICRPANTLCVGGCLPRLHFSNCPIVCTYIMRNAAVLPCTEDDSPARREGGLQSPACFIAFELMYVHVVQEGGLTGARGQPPSPHPQNELGNKVPRGEECNCTG